MDKQTQGQPEQGSVQRTLQPLSDAPRRAGESYSEHLARVMQDADHARALLQARYRALHVGIGHPEDDPTNGGD